ncbi:Dynamin- GTPase protein [Dimargaris cristalligena]|uniref:Dynamin central region-domain-containing protein n=1 Tax=Dimargaris cristalligena TaxID=215637 RepID=A0A4P9ZTX7_9FUNG|nr:Dynamin- GTPase protein [Dimargaris cristalligena]RKP36967.1 Dynamin central region-domain-containing protein [Dimargaris cristalligena]|eukprot:RKP36967.1 Dynamin central region-domain-containing protein [Dimargaris cristalligena]
MEDLIPVVNRLQDVFNTVGQDQIDLPQIVVVGSQSSGKSSVLENLVGRDFLPRGTGIVTRRPLVLQLVNVPKRKPSRRPQSSETTDTNEGAPASEGDEEFPERAQFLHLPDRQFSDFGEVRLEIQRETERLAGDNKGICHTPIHLKITSPHVLNLTLVDLPGLTKIPVGDQPTDIEMQTRDLVMEYITKPNSVILAVSPANVDLVNSESLKLARDVDPDGRRTLGVVTKIDLMDGGTNALDILTGRVFPLRLGFVGIVNRSQQDTLAAKPIQEALKFEREFFRKEPVYRAIANRCGTSHLSKILNQVLMNHIREKLPDIKTKINALISQTEQELASYGAPALAGQGNPATLFLRLLTQFSNQYNSSIEGNGTDLGTTELCGGARLYYIFNNIYGAALDSINPCANLTDHDIRMAIRNSTGPRPSLFVPELAFELLVKPQIKCLESPSQRCVQLAYEELMKICQSCGSKELQKYPRLYAKVIEVVSDLLRERVAPTVQYVESLISIQRSYINTNHPDFIGGSGALVDLQRKAEAKKRESYASARSHRSAGYDDPADMDDHGGVSDSDSANLAGRVRPHPARGSLSLPYRPHSVAGVHSQARSNAPPSGDKFLNYFFGGGKTDSMFLGDDVKRPSLPIPNRVKESNTPSISLPGDEDVMHELTSRFDQSCDTNPDRDQLETELIRSLISSYFGIVRKCIQDLVPKAIMHLLVNFTREILQNRLVETLYKDVLMEELLQEDESLIAERTKCESMLEVYRKAFAIISEAP